AAAGGDDPGSLGGPAFAAGGVAGAGCLVAALLSTGSAGAGGAGGGPGSPSGGQAAFAREPRQTAGTAVGRGPSTVRPAGGAGPCYAADAGTGDGLPSEIRVVSA